MKTGIVVFTGYNSRAVIAFCRFLKSQGLQAHLIAKDPQDPIFMTYYRNWVCTIRQSPQLDINQCLKYFKTIKGIFGYQKILIAPTSEFLNRFFLIHQATIQKYCVSIPLVDFHLYKTISDKFSFRNICQQNGLYIPKLLAAESKIYPFVAKKRTYDTGSGIQAKPYLIFNDTDYNNFCARESTADYYFEEFILGESHYLLYYISYAGEVISYSQQNLVQQADGKSIIAARYSNIHADSVGYQYSQMLISLGFHGLIMIEVRKCADKFIMIEANPRFWGPLQYAVDNCPDLLHTFLSDQLIVPEKTQLRSQTEIIQHKAALKIKDMNNSCVSKFMPANLGFNVADKQHSYFWYGGYVNDQVNGRITSFHQYDFITMHEELHAWLASDIFLRQDTIHLFRAELNGCFST